MTKILVVDDFQAGAALIGRMLTMNGLTVKLCSSGEEALKELVKNAESYDIVLTDLKMPGMNGYDVCRETLKFKLPVIVLTSQYAPEDRRRALEAGAAMYLTKPISRTDLVAAVQMTIAATESERLLGQALGGA